MNGQATLSVYSPIADVNCGRKAEQNPKLMFAFTLSTLKTEGVAVGTGGTFDKQPRSFILFWMNAWIVYYPQIHPQCKPVMRNSLPTPTNSLPTIIERNQILCGTPTISSYIIISSQNHTLWWNCQASIMIQGFNPFNPRQFITI